MKLSILRNPLWTDGRTLFGLWMLIAVVAGIVKQGNNNYKIFVGVFRHAWHGLSLYAPYPAEHFDTNHYGPFFSLLIAPFAVCPDWLGIVLWEVMMTLCLYVAIRKLPLSDKVQACMLWFCAHELLTALFMAQFNVVIAAIIIATWWSIEKERDGMAAFLILIGTFVKLYGIVGLAFFPFSRHKARFAGWFVLWAAVMFVLPMLVGGPEYVLGQYAEWYESLTSKNQENLESLHQNISLMGLVVRPWRALSPETVHLYSNLCLLLPGLSLFALPYLRFRQWGNVAFRYTFLASTLLFVVLFSTGSESSGYITAMLGVAIWYWTAPWQRGRWAVAMMAFVFVLTSLSPSDLFPAYIRREIVMPYALKALPCAMVWFWLVYEMLTRDYAGDKR